MKYTSYLKNLTTVGLISLIKVATSIPVEPTTLEVLTSVYGPLDTWHTIRAIDLYPNDIFDGHPVNESIIYAYEPPNSSDVQKQALVRSLLSKKSELQRRMWRVCYKTGNWVSNAQLDSGLIKFCQESANYDKREQVKSWWKASDGKWYRFTNQIGAYNDVYFYAEATDGHTIVPRDCINIGEEIFTFCSGSNPDTAGGKAGGSAYHEVTIDPNE
jgi:hypothetical protein